jgi:hypothetical protein
MSERRTLAFSIDPSNLLYGELSACQSPPSSVWGYFSELVVLVKGKGVFVISPHPVDSGGTIGRSNVERCSFFLGGVPNFTPDEHSSGFTK